MQKTLPALDLNQRYSIDEACAYLRISRAYIYKLIKSNSLPTVEDGSRRFVSGQTIADRSRAPAQAA
jgi:excisionase family DNA binding protein